MKHPIFDVLRRYDYEQLIFCQEESLGLRAIIAVHDTTLGPAVGGVRMLPYETEQQAIDDVLRLARGMTYKAAAAGVNHGGAKCVVLGDPKHDKSEALFRALGRFVERLGGRYIAGEDVGTTASDMDAMGAESDHIFALLQRMRSRISRRLAWFRRYTRACNRFIEAPRCVGAASLCKG